MKVLLIDVNCKGSSTGKIVYDLYCRLRQDGHRAAICYGRGPLVQEEDIYKFGLDPETNIHAGLARLTGLNGCFSPLSTGRLIRFIENFQPDVVHIHELHAYFVNLAPLLGYLKKKRIPIIWTFHCAYMYTGRCGVPGTCQGWQTGCKRCPHIREYPKSLFFDFAAPMLRQKKKLLQALAFTIVTPSRFLGQQVKSSFLADKPCHFVPNGIDATGVFYPRSQAECAVLRERYGLTGKQVVLSVAPDILSDQKGGKTVLALSEQLPDLHFVLIGTEESGSPAANVTLLKRTADQQELALWYSASDVFLICSKHENFPTTCLEAMCCGTPVAGLDSGGSKETVPAPYGLFVEEAALPAAIATQLTQKTEGIAQLGAALYDKTVMYRAYLALYEKEVTHGR